jgi:ankyrin repeat protein/phage baseplate assembly protein gpV
VVAAQRGNVDALNLLLLFGEGFHARRKGNERALYYACEQGNVLAAATLLGRVPLRPPKHPHHVARRLGLVRACWPVYAPGHVYTSAVAQGPYSVPAAIANTKIRAELAAATGMATNNGPRASASAAAAVAERAGSGAGAAGAGGGAGSDSGLASSVEASVSQLEHFENDGRYRSWCRGYHMGTYWSLYDTALANYETLHGPIGAEAMDQPDAGITGSTAGGAGGTTASGAGSSSSGGGGGSISRWGRKEKPSPSAAQAALPLVRRVCTVDLSTLARRLSLRLAPGSAGAGFPLEWMVEGRSVTPAYANMALLTSRLPRTMLIVQASRPRPRTMLHPALPPPIDYGRIAAEAIAIKVRVNVGPSDGKTPLLVCAEKGRTEIAYLLLSHVDPAFAASGQTPELPKKNEDDEPPAAVAAAAAAAGGAAHAAPAAAAGAAAAAAGPAAPAAAAAGAGAPGAPAAGAAAAAAAAPPAPVLTAAQIAAREALGAIALATSSALAVPPEFVVSAPWTRRAESLSELLKEQRDRADVEQCPTGQNTPLCLACERGDDRLVALLLHWGADVNRQGRKETTPLLTASTAGHEHIIRLLLKTSLATLQAKAVIEAAGEILMARDAEAMGACGATGGGAGNALGRSMRGPLLLDQDAKAAAADESAGGVGPVDDPYAARPTAALDRDLSLSMRDQLFSALNIMSQESIALILRAVGGKNTSSNVASSVGGIVSSQNGGRRRMRGFDNRKPEDAVLDFCEPAVLLAVQIVAAAAAPVDPFDGAVSPGAVLVAPWSSSQPLNPSIYAPPEDAATYSFGGMSALSMQSFYRSASGTMRKMGGAGSGALAMTLANAGRASSRGGNGASGAEEMEAALEELLAPTLDIPSSSAVYMQVSGAAEILRAQLRAVMHQVIARSRIASGIGAMVGRPIIDINRGDESGYTPLFIAASTGKLDSVRVLVAAGADASLPTKRGKTPIYGAVEKGFVEVVEALIHRYTAHQIRANTTYGTNVMHAANKAGNNRIKDLIAQYCADWDAKETKRIKAERTAQRITGDPTRQVSQEEILRRQDIYMKRMMGMSKEEIMATISADASSGDPEAAAIADTFTVDVSGTIDRLRKMAEAAKKKEAELEARRSNQKERLAAAYGGLPRPPANAARRPDFDNDDGGDTPERKMPSATETVLAAIEERKKQLKDEKKAERGRSLSARERGTDGASGNTPAARARSAAGSSSRNGSDTEEAHDLSVSGSGNGPQRQQLLMKPNALVLAPQSPAVGLPRLPSKGPTRESKDKEAADKRGHSQGPKGNGPLLPRALSGTALSSTLPSRTPVADDPEYGASRFGAGVSAPGSERKAKAAAAAAREREERKLRDEDDDTAVIPRPSLSLTSPKALTVPSGAASKLKTSPLTQNPGAKPPKSAAAATTYAATTSAASADPVFQRLAANAKEIEQKRLKAQQDYDAALKAAANLPLPGSKSSSKDRPSSAEGKGTPALPSSQAAHASSTSASREVASAGSSGSGAHAARTLRASKTPSGVASSGTTPVAAPEPMPVAAGQSGLTGAGASAEEIRAKRAAFFVKRFSTDGTADAGTAAAASAAASAATPLAGVRPVSPIRAPMSPTAVKPAAKIDVEGLSVGMVMLRQIVGGSLADAGRSAAVPSTPSAAPNLLTSYISQFSPRNLGTFDSRLSAADVSISDIRPPAKVAPAPVQLQAPSSDGFDARLKVAASNLTVKASATAPSTVSTSAPSKVTVAKTALLSTALGAGIPSAGTGRGEGLSVGGVGLGAPGVKAVPSMTLNLGNGSPALAGIGKVNKDDIQARDERIRIREMQKALRIAMAKEEEERKAREIVAAAAQAAPALSSLKLATVAYGSASIFPKKKKVTKPAGK